MLKVYGSELCPDCIECKYNLDRNNIEYENKDITKNLKYMKEFLRLRDKEATFDDARDNGYIGIPALVTDDGKLTLDWESFFTEQGIEVVHPGNEGAACGIDGVQRKDRRSDQKVIVNN